MSNSKQGVICEPLKGIARVNRALVWSETEVKTEIKREETMLEVEKVSSELDHFTGYVIKVLSKSLVPSENEGEEPKEVLVKSCIAIDEEVIEEIIKMRGYKPVI